MSREKKLPELSSDARSFLARAQRARGRDVARERRVGARIAASVAVAAAVVPATASAATGTAITIGVVLRVVAAIVLVAGVASAPVWRPAAAPIGDAPARAPARPSPPVSPTEVAAPAVVAVPLAVPPAPVVDPAPVSIGRRRARRAVIAPAIVAQAPTAPTEDEIAADVALLTRGVRALRDGDAAHAAALLREHAARYPQSQFAPERDAALARAAAAGAQDGP